MIRFFLVIVALSLFSTHLLACDTADIRQQLTRIESETLLKNAPTFKHAYQDGAIKLDWLAIQANGSVCQAQLQVTLPAADLAEANDYLQQNPAKRILMAAQGYAVAEQPTQKVDFLFKLDQNNVVADNQDNFALRQLHSNIEYTYQLLAQLRIAVSYASQNNTAWPNALQQAEKSSCISSAKSTASGCDCRVHHLQKHISPRQKELIDYIRQQPYSVAAGAMDGYVQLSKQIDQACMQQ